MKNMTSDFYTAIRDLALKYIHEELIPLEKETGLGPEDTWPRDLLNPIWKRSHELELLKAEIAETGSLLSQHVHPVRN
ncbi:hypothetical protein [Sporosarcina obsidiansis]|uniref:hypothetical protein n=1 Tax=Sporosarcina obsidiansis TaxID=2660748 RepID=UPI00129BDF39|nr:hypothetical protein [Sporosarcina obsidiansis]